MQQVGECIKMQAAASARLPRFFGFGIVFVNNMPNIGHDVAPKNHANRGGYINKNKVRGAPAGGGWGIPHVDPVGVTGQTP